FHLNLGNDRPNITPEVEVIPRSLYYPALDFLMSRVEHVSDMPRTLVFVNSVNDSQEASLLISSTHDNLHGPKKMLRSIKTLVVTMSQFCKGKVRMMVVTEVGRIGLDIPDIELVIQLGVPSSLTIWLQQASRAACLVSIQGRAILLAEASVFC
ncbi:hypothetical protein SERLA73DRAFT_58177, partial [Serpula lacrymans var. lacrymans S7.3]